MQKVYRLIIIGVLMSALGSLGLSAQIKGYNIVVSVTPDHQDWNYKVGEKANFTVNVRKSGTLLNNVKVDYEAGPADVSGCEEKYHPQGWYDEMERKLE